MDKMLLGRVRTLNGNPLSLGDYILYYSSRVGPGDLSVGDFNYLAENYFKRSLANGNLIELSYLVKPESKIISISSSKKDVRFLKVTGLDQVEIDQFEGSLSKFHKSS